MADTRYLCVTVTEASPGAATNLERLIASLDRQGVEVDLVLVVRGGADNEPPYVRGHVTVHPLASPRVIALSTARNVALAHARRTALLDKADVVAFPDDDCRYGDGLLIRVASDLASSGCQAVAGAYGPCTNAVDRRRFPLGDATLTPRLVMRVGCSAAMFLTGTAVRAIGDFDVRLGLGATYGASEDADYALRFLALGFTGAYRPTDIVVEHPYKANRPAEYYLGNVAVLAKHARGRVGIRLLLARRLAGGVLLVLRSQMPFARLRQSVRAALALLRERPDKTESGSTAFVPTASGAVDLDRPLRDLDIAPSRSGYQYRRALILARLHEQPLGVVDVDVVDGRVRAIDVADAVLASLSAELEGHVGRRGCATVPACAATLLEAGYGPASGCDGRRRSATDELPAVAVIVPTAGRPDDVRRCLARLVAVDYPRLEIVVVDNRPDEDATRLVVEQAANDNPRIRYVGERLPGSSVARNRGLAETQAGIVVFTDDDVEVDPLWVRWMVEPLVQDEQVQVVTGLVLPACYDTLQQQQFEETAGFGKGFCRRVYDMGPNRPRKQMLYPYWGAPFGSGNSMAFRRHALLAIGGFDPALGAGSLALAGADIESFTHIVRQGGRLVYEPRAIVWHDHRRDEASLGRQLFNYGVGSTAIMTKWLLRDPRVIVAVARAAWMLAARPLAACRGHTGEGTRELSRLRGQRALSGEQFGRGRQLRSLATGPWLYLRSRRWAKRHSLAAVLDGATATTRG